VGYVLEEFRFHKFRDTRAPYWLSIKSLSSRTSHGAHVYVAVKNANVHPAVYNDGSASGKKIMSPFRGSRSLRASHVVRRFDYIGDHYIFPKDSEDSMSDINRHV
jgi:hypothetical protein